MPVMASKIASLRPLARRALSTTLRRKEEQHVLRSAYAPQVMPPGGLTQYLLQTAKEHSHKTYMVDGVSGETLSYGTLVDKIHRFGGHIQSRMGGIEPRVGIFMANNMEYAPLLLGTISVGAVATTLNHTYTAGEVAYQVMDSEANILVVDSAREKRALKAIGMIEEEVRQGTYKKPVPELLVVGESKTGRSNLRRLLEDPTAPFATEVELDSESTSIIPYSSGTTGRPKGVEVKHGAFSTCTEMFNNPDVMRAFKADQQDIVMGVLPYYHMYGMLVLLMVTLRKGGTVLNLSRFDPDEFNNAIRTYKPTILPCVPPMLKFLVETDGLTREDLKQVHSLVCGAAPVSKNSVEKFAAKTGGNIDFSEGYGMTEVLVTHSTPKTNPKLGFCGQLMPNCEAKIIDTDTGLALPANQRGELLLKTPCMMNGYYNKPEATAETIDSEGWLHTGDIAFYDEDHFFSIVDRIKELIKVKGYQVSPSELEDVLLKHSGIADVGIVGVEDERCGEVPRAYIIPSKGHDLTETEVNAYMAVHLARHKQLAGGIKFVEELPKNPSGKLLRRVLQQQANAGD